MPKILIQILWLICWSFGLLNAKISDCNQIFIFKNCIFIFQSTIDSIYLSYSIVINDDPMSFFKKSFSDHQCILNIFIGPDRVTKPFFFWFCWKNITVNMGISNYMILFMIIFIIIIDNLHLFIYCLSSAQKRASEVSCNFPELYV